MDSEIFNLESTKRVLEIHQTYLKTITVGYKMGSFSREDALKELESYKDETIFVKEKAIKKHPDLKPVYDELIRKTDEAKEVIENMEDVMVVPISISSKERG